MTSRVPARPGDGSPADRASGAPADHVSGAPADGASRAQANRPTGARARLGAGTPAGRAARVPIALAVAAVMCQIVYPLVEGPARDVNTIATVVLFSAASLSDAWVHRGWRTALAVAVVFVGGGLLVEVVGVATGFPFGSYAYADRLGPMLGGVPVIIPLAWAMLGYPALVVARLITGHRWLGIGVGGVALAAWDLYLDPQMVAEGYWRWSGAGPHLIGSVPVTNYLAWLVIAWLMMALLWPLVAARPHGTGDQRVPVALYLWTWAGSLLAHVAFFDLPQSGLYGGVSMGAVVALLIHRLRQASDTAASPPSATVRSTHPTEPPAPARRTGGQTR